MSTKIIELGTYHKVTLHNKWLIKAESSVDFVKNDPIGSYVLDEKGNRIGKVLDIIGNIKNPYALVLPLVDPNNIPQGKLYIQVSIPSRKRHHRR
ncbi:MAG: Gar1/Naf1 family protein [Sulfolobaceae archaeon]|nr:Gar1/Naf1 family protein [Sulfolobaceae archaeon]